MAAKFSAQDLYGVDPYEGFPLDRWPERLHGWFSDAPVFEEVISKVKPDLIIEVGSWLGASAIHMAGLLKKHGLDESAIICVDTWLGAVEFWGDHADATRYGQLLIENGSPQVQKQFIANVLHQGLRDTIIPFQQESGTAARVLNRMGVRADVIYIDASHLEDDVERDIRVWWPLLREGGVMMGDDYEAWPQVARAVHRVLGDGVHVDGNKWVVRKGPQGPTFGKAPEKQAPVIAACNMAFLELESLPGPSAVIRMADDTSLLRPIKDEDNVWSHLDLCFNDATEDYGAIHAPTEKEAKAIAEFARSIPPEHNIVVACTQGKGRSRAVAAALHLWRTGHPSSHLDAGSHNRLLYDLTCDALGLGVSTEPVVSIVVRVKYPVDRLQAFLLSVSRQRWTNWEVVIVTDGPNPDARSVFEWFNEQLPGKTKFVETGESKGRWGHPHRNAGIAAATGEFICFQNDDNYLTPGYVEQLVKPLLSGAGLSVCHSAHSYIGWQQSPSPDLGSFMFRTELARRIPWPSDDVRAEIHYLQDLQKAVGGRVVVVDRPLFVKN